jgi:integrase
MAAKPKPAPEVWPVGVVWKPHKRQTPDGETETVRTPYVRVRYTKDGRRRSLWQQVKTPAEAVRVRARLLDKLATDGATEYEHARKTFADLARYYKPIYLIAAKYVDGRKVEGRRDLLTAELTFDVLTKYFGTLRLRSLTYGAVKTFKAHRLKTKTQYNRPRSITTVHRELQLLRHMLSVAVREGWLARNPFNCGEPLINPADERARKRILSREEEGRLLAACGERINTYQRKGREVTAHDDGHLRAHLRPLLICLLDTAMRSGEALKLTWDDLDFDPRRLTVREFNTKTLSERAAPITERLARELQALYPRTGKRADRLVFGVTDNIHRSFHGACKAAGIEDLRVHDLRRTAATRLHRGGMPIAEIARILGHSSIVTTYRYIGVDDETVTRAAAIFNAQNDAAQEAETIN